MVTLDELRDAVRYNDQHFDVPSFCSFAGLDEDEFAHVATQRALRGICLMDGQEINEQNFRAITENDRDRLAIVAAAWVDGFTAAHTTLERTT